MDSDDTKSEYSLPTQEIEYEIENIVSEIYGKTDFEEVEKDHNRQSNTIPRTQSIRSGKEEANPQSEGSADRSELKPKCIEFVYTSEDVLSAASESTTRFALKQIEKRDAEEKSAKSECSADRSEYKSIKTLIIEWIIEQHEKEKNSAKSVCGLLDLIEDGIKELKKRKVEAEFKSIVKKYVEYVKSVDVPESDIRSTLKSMIIQAVERDLKKRKAEEKSANPQSFAYFSFLFAVVGIITFQLGAVRLLLRQNPSLFKDHGGVFMIMIIVSGCMAVLSSFVLVLSSFLLESWMKNIHYTILKTIGSFSAILVPFFLGAAVFVPSGDLNWVAYTVLCVIFGGLLYLYSFIWNVACAYHKEEEEHFNKYLVHWAYLLIILVPFSISLLSFFSPNLGGSTEKTLLPF